MAKKWKKPDKLVWRTQVLLRYREDSDSGTDFELRLRGASYGWAAKATVKFRPFFCGGLEMGGFQYYSHNYYGDSYRNCIQVAADPANLRLILASVERYAKRNRRGQVHCNLVLGFHEEWRAALIAYGYNKTSTWVNPNTKNTIDEYVYHLKGSQPIITTEPAAQ